MVDLIIYIILIILVLFLILKKKRRSDVVNIVSPYDNNTYQVVEAVDKEEASSLLGQIREKIFMLSNYLYQRRDKYPKFKDHIIQLSQRIQNVVISENTHDSEYTSYSVNKGDEMVICLRSKQDNSLHDLNLIMYVVLHEMAHVACPEQGHTELFKKIFIFLQEEAIKLGIYTHVEYDVDPHNYCGITIRENLLR
jgi:hypothetical protein